MKNIKVDIEKIKTLRKKAGISIEKMSEFLGYDSLNGYYYLETGRIKFPAEKLALVAKILEVPYGFLFFEEEFAKMANKE
ncbi:helix-turn-helix transcriptional regulator [Neobacillus sp. OS1-2]|uniref:helix-turn-helix domain-containing protein n=1 Tax=Neobacillus sp. OS1-2 TaxID=3070680 RepID=UPI0027E1283D|nr:helix-turn-helix transcriptional regulator [Neobacillus sp. OS1-2]WML38668.1 helix-turn-helix transcriptional regulator [Neobacillus sp. OS1-2]